MNRIRALVISIVVGMTAFVHCQFDPLPGSPTSDAGDAAVQSRFEIVNALAEGQALTGIWGADKDRLYVVGTDGVRMTYDAKTGWIRSQSRKGTNAQVVWGRSRSDVYTGGGIGGENGTPITGGFIDHFDGTGWASEYLPADEIYGIWGDNTATFAVGSHGHVYGKANGTTDWAVRGTLAPSPDVKTTSESPILTRIVGRGTFDNCLITTDSPRLYRTSIAQKTFIFLDQAVQKDIKYAAAWFAPGTNGELSVYLGSNYYGAYFLHGDADTTIPEDMFQLYADLGAPENTQRFIRDIWGTTTQVMFVGDQGKVLLFDVISRDPIPVTSPTNANLYGIWGSGPDDVWIVGEHEQILHGSFPPRN